jgi:hypothetical protein
MSDLSRFLIIVGLLLVGAGVGLWLVGKVPWLGKLPGDITYQRGHFKFYFPLATCILISLILTLILYLFRK